MHTNCLKIMTVVYSNLRHHGFAELAAPINFYYKRYEHAEHAISKERIFQEFLDYCEDYDIVVSEILYMENPDVKKSA